MNKTAIQTFAKWARTELISRVSQKALQFGITADGYEPEDALIVNGKVITEQEKAQRQALIKQVNKSGYKQTIEQVAYTWFNRFSALRFMEVNDYLPSHVRVFTDSENAFKPQILDQAMTLDLPNLNHDKVNELILADNQEELYKYLLITQCNALNTELPGMFQTIDDYTELLFPDKLLCEGSVLEQMVSLIPYDDWKDAVQIIGWLYQYYNIDPKAEVDKKVKAGKKVSKEELPAKTQLFTPDWIVRYMVENSLGRMWLEGHPNDELKQTWRYYLDEAQQEPDVEAQLVTIRQQYAQLSPEKITVIDPCCGSGHILAYLFDVLMQIYISVGYTERDAVESIIKNNLYGIDIDPRAQQLAYFSVMMKGRQYDRGFFRRNYQPHVYDVPESNAITTLTTEEFCNNNADLKKAIDTIVEEFKDAREFGSMITPTVQNWSVLNNRIDEMRNSGSLQQHESADELAPIIEIAQILANKYDIVVTNPPYMTIFMMNENLSNFAKEYFPITKGDLFAIFIERNNLFLKSNGLNSIVTMQSWMFLSSFEKMRLEILNNRTITNLMHMDNSVMGIAFGTVVSITLCSKIVGYKGTYNQVKNVNITNDIPVEFPVTNNRFAVISQDNFSKIPGNSIAYWISNKFLKIFDNPQFYDYSISASQNKTGDNGKYVRYFWEVCNTTVGRNKKWLFYAKGGGFRKWYGNLIDVVDWSESARETYRTERCAQIVPEEYWYKPGITWGKITSNLPSFRILPEEATFDVGGSSIFFKSLENYYYYLALLNSKIFYECALIFNPTFNIQVKDVRSMPIIIDRRDTVIPLVEKTVAISQTDWDSFETSWDFQKHPLVRSVPTIAEAYSQWENECNERFQTLKANEEELNRIFISIYDLEGEITPEVEEKDVTVRRADVTREVKSLISYSVGCMFGRYSLDEPGLIYAGGEWNDGHYSSFPADPDNIIPITDNEYFEDDIVGRFIKFVSLVFGSATLEENLSFIASALGGSGDAREVIRNYFLNGFFKDHVSMYHNLPIYWQFDSGKKGGFKALMYMHRYDPDMLARMRTDYIHNLQGRYDSRVTSLQSQIENAPSRSAGIQLKKQLEVVQAKANELHQYEEKVHHLADQRIDLDLDDGVKHNYALFQEILSPLK